MIFGDWPLLTFDCAAPPPPPAQPHRGRRSGLVSVLCAALLAVLTACGPLPDETQPMKAPLFRLKSMQGEEVALEAQRGKIVVLDFWATWCHPCVEQIPILNRFYERNREAGVELYGISMDVDGVEAVEPFMKKHVFRYPVLLGQLAVAESYGIRSFPASVVIDAEGNIRSMHVGVVDERTLEKLVARARTPLKKSSPVTEASKH